jgi:hypothetical protein
MKRGLIIIALIPGILGCKKHSPEVVPVPGVVTLSLPAQNSACTTGTNITNTQSTITFTWIASANTDKYEVDVKNLSTNVVTPYPATQPQLAIPLALNTPFSWFVVSKSNRTAATSKSDIWKFYNAGPGTLTFAPFPADLTSPTFGEQVPAGTITLKWQGGAVTIGSSLTYDVYFGTNSNPPLQSQALTTNSLGGISVISGNTYYWKVVTKDTFNNITESQVSQFEVQ